MIILDETLLIGKGSERWCYQHPKMPELCIKVAVIPPKPGRKPQSEREAQYLQLLAKRQTPFTHISAYFGMINTNLGIGYLFRTVRDIDGSLSQRLEEVQTRLTQTEITRLMSVLRSYMLQYAVVPCDMSVKNILLQKGQQDSRLVLVDGVGNKDFIPLASYCLPYARLKIARIWQKFLKRLNLELPKPSLHHYSEPISTQ